MIAWNDFRDETPVSLGTRTDIYAGRIQSGGAIPPGWAANGVPATRDSAEQDFGEIGPDGFGGAYLAWEDWRSYPTTGLTDVYAQHLLFSGTVGPGWPPNGLAVTQTQTPKACPSVLPDGSGGVVVVWVDGRRGGTAGQDVDIYAQHLLAEAIAAPGWAGDGLPVVIGRTKPHVTPDAAGGFYVGCSTVNSTGADLEYYVQRSPSRESGHQAGPTAACCSAAPSGIATGSRRCRTAWAACCSPGSITARRRLRTRSTRRGSSPTGRSRGGGPRTGRW